MNSTSELILRLRKEYIYHTRCQKRFSLDDFMNVAMDCLGDSLELRKHMAQLYTKGSTVIRPRKRPEYFMRFVLKGPNWDNSRRYGK